MLTGCASDIENDATSTKQPIIYEFQKADNYSAETKRERDGKIISANKFTSEKDLNIFLKQSQKEISGSITDEKLFVSIFGPHCLDKHFVDFPGDIRDPIEKDSNIRNMHYKNFQSPLNIYISELSTAVVILRMIVN